MPFCTRTLGLFVQVHLFKVLPFSLFQVLLLSLIVAGGFLVAILIATICLISLTFGDECCDPVPFGHMVGQSFFAHSLDESVLFCSLFGWSASLFL